MKRFFESFGALEDVFEFLLLTVLVFATGLLLSIPIWVAIDEGDSRFLMMYVPYVFAVVVAYLIKRKC